MKKTKDFNNISDELLKEVQLKPGQTATFKLLGIRPDPNNEGRFLIPQAVSIREFDTAYDPKKQEWVDIAHVTSVNNKGEVTAQPVYFTKDEQGVITLDGNYPADAAKAVYLRLSSYNESNPHRNKAVRARFFEVNPIADAEKKTKARQLRRDAMTTAANMTDEEIAEMYASLGNDTAERPGIMREHIESLAETNPEQFNIHYSDKSRSIKATLKRAVDTGVLSLDLVGAKFQWAATGETAFTFAKKAGAEPYTEFADYILTSKGGDKVLEEVKKSLNAKKK